MSAGLVILLVAVVAAVAYGAWRAATDGRFRVTGSRRRRSLALAPARPAGAGSAQSTGVDPATGTGEPEAVTWDAVRRALPQAEPGERATLLQFSSAFCAPCRATRRVLGDVAATEPGVSHLEVDAEQHLALVRELGILKTPTTILLDATGAEVTRASGAPRPEQVRTALAGL